MPDSLNNPISSGWSDDPAARMALWMDQRLPLPQMLRALAEDHGGRAAPGLRAMADRAEAGDDLAEAFRATSGQLPRELRRQLAVAAESGNLRTAIPAAAGARVTGRGLATEGLAILGYPAAVAVAVALILLLFSLFLIPQFESIFSDFGLDLPALTEVVIAGSRVLPVALAVTACLLVAAAVLWRVPVVDRWLHWLATAVPLFGRLWSCFGHQSFSQLLAAYTAAGMQGADALRAAAAGLSDQNLAHAARTVAARCEAGAGMGEAMAHSRHFERSLSSLVQWGEQHGDLPAALAEAAAGYQSQMQNLLTLVRRVTPPALFTVVAGTVLVMVVSLFLPLVSLIQNLA